MRKRNLNDDVEALYCFYPEFYTGILKTILIPKIELSDILFAQSLAKVFNIDKAKIYYPQKYIYFASVGDFEGGKPVGEVALAKKISKIVGKENLLIKLHPRDKTGLFEKEGLTVDKESSVPWEVIQLNYNFKNHVFLTCASGSVLSINLTLEEGPETYFMFPLCKVSQNECIAPSVAQAKKVFAQLEKSGHAALKRFHIAYYIEDILSE